MEIKDVLKMKLRIKDTLVIAYDADIVTEDEVEESQKVLKEMFPKNKILFVPKEMSISIVSSE